MAIIDFWYDFASTYSYPAAMRIERLAHDKDVAVRWRPFLLGPIFTAQRWATSPFNLYPAKGRNMVRDLERVCAKAGLPFAMPNPFPQNSLLAARVACSLDDTQRSAFSRAVYAREFGEGKSIGTADDMAPLLMACGIDSHDTLARATGEENKVRLKTQTAEAQRLNIFGAPSFVTPAGELFWGNDRLEAAIDWAATEKRVPC